MHPSPRPAGRGTIVLLTVAAVVVLAVAIGAVVYRFAGSSDADSARHGDRTTVFSDTKNPVPQARPRVVVDGRDQNVRSPVLCVTSSGMVNIAIGDPSAPIGAVLTEGDTPDVKSISLGMIDGVPLGYPGAISSPKPTATKQGAKYKITGSAIGVDVNNPLTPVTKPFEIEVTCP